MKNSADLFVRLTFSSESLDLMITKLFCNLLRVVNINMLNCSISSLLFLRISVATKYRFHDGGVTDTTETES